MKATSNVYLLGFMFTLCIVIIDSSCSSNYPNRQRSTRGFKNAALSTARGFGKRDGFVRNADVTMEFPFDTQKESGEGFVKVLSDPERYSIKWLVDELSKNPRFARIINRKLNNINEEIIPEDSMSENFPKNLEY